MPLYDYRCQKCEAEQKDVRISSLLVTTVEVQCPTCRKPMERIFPKPALKADGAYSFNAR